VIASCRGGESGKRLRQGMGVHVREKYDYVFILQGRRHACSSYSGEGFGLGAAAIMLFEREKISVMYDESRVPRGYLGANHFCTSFNEIGTPL